MGVGGGGGGDPSKIGKLLKTDSALQEQHESMFHL